MTICRLNVTLCQKYKESLISFLHDGVKNDRCMDSFTLEIAASYYHDMTEQVRSGKAVVFGIFKEDCIKGFIWSFESFFRDDRKRLYINSTYVDTNYRRQHLGSALVKKMKTYAETAGYHALFLQLEEYRIDELNFYKAQGFMVERIQLYKEVVSVFNDSPEIKMLTADKLAKDIWIFSELFLQNLHAHVLTDCFDLSYSMGKMQDLCRYLEQEKACCFFSEMKGCVVGFIWGYQYPYKSENRMLISAIQVSGEWRGHNIGGKLVRTLEKAAHEKGICKVYTHTDGVNIQAQHFYHTHGFRDEEYQIVLPLKQVIE